MKMDVIRAGNVHLSFTKLFSFDCSKKHGNITYILKRLQIVLGKCFGQPPPDALVTIENTLASTDIVPGL